MTSDDEQSDRSLSFTQSQRFRIQNRSNPPDVCWFCEVGLNTKCTHLIPRAERHLFDRLQDAGRLSFSDVNDIENGVPLCPNCHQLYNSCGDPGITFYPLHLDYFLTYEETDFERRKALWPSAGFTKRGTPTAENYYSQTEDVNQSGGLYRRVIVRPSSFAFQQTEIIGTVNPPKSWSGCPNAAIAKAECALTPSYAIHIPQPDVDKLHRLIVLYIENDEALRKMALQTAPAAPGAFSDNATFQH